VKTMKKKAEQKTPKPYDAVKMMRTIREQLSVRYWENPALEKKELREAREKFLASRSRGPGKLKRKTR